MRLIEEWKTVLWNSAVSRTTALLTFLVGALSQAYMAAFAFLAFMPQTIQIFVGGAIVTIVIGGPIILSRIVYQPKMQAKAEIKAEERHSADQSE